MKGEIGILTLLDAGFGIFLRYVGPFELVQSYVCTQIIQDDIKNYQNRLRNALVVLNKPIKNVTIVTRDHVTILATSMTITIAGLSQLHRIVHGTAPPLVKEYLEVGQLRSPSTREVATRPLDRQFQFFLPDTLFLCAIRILRQYPVR